MALQTPVRICVYASDFHLAIGKSRTVSTVLYFLGCDHDCPLDRFIDLTKPMIPVDWEKECALKTDHSTTSVPVSGSDKLSFILSCIIYMIMQLVQELPGLGLLCLQKSVKGYLCEVHGVNCSLGASLFTLTMWPKTKCTCIQIVC